MSQKRVAVVLSGCGHQDGAEIRESVITLLELDKAGAKVTIFAPDILQKDVINHISGQPMSENRNVMVEAARIARGEIKDLKMAKEIDFDALVLPGGFGAAKNLSDIAEKGLHGTVIPELKSLINDFIKAKKPIGVICISPAVLVAAVRETLHPTVTLGPVDANSLISGQGAEHEATTAAQHVMDKTNKISSCAAYMTDEPLAAIAKGIEGVVKDVLAIA